MDTAVNILENLPLVQYEMGVGREENAKDWAMTPILLGGPMIS